MWVLTSLPSNLDQLAIPAAAGFEDGDELRSVSPCYLSPSPTGGRGDRDCRGLRRRAHFPARRPHRCSLRCSLSPPERTARPPPTHRWCNCCWMAENIFLCEGMMWISPSQGKLCSHVSVSGLWKRHTDAFGYQKFHAFLHTLFWETIQ